MKKFFGYMFFGISVLPILLPIFFSFVALFTKKGFLYDYLMPAELIGFTIIGSIGIIFFALKKHVMVKKLIYFLTLEIASILFAQIYSVAAGLAHGDTQPVGIHAWIIGICIVLWHLFLILLCIENFKVLKKSLR
ncbi:hypothetical protein SU69_04245 [Thermosipho melanesiensis]|uniref:Uncharacterized protein n=2 Tax=Thermosipho melanesiensis TaxID=46541 RepID=A6LL92_THEM4|nr:hypothetical protein [Thermosipho melanesiensis]ABR30693.1 hypothetical protein Tmel_0832 [Thermosipho melanesiensis BI429]APT73824.1 hypothetical protein BW47_04475 [Thermosipho melanesiensis]OOC35762.1 hypothetical protein SU68_04300 [Thermosipho melanesiensis]OOC39061.1 hypothetical protein SU69_04245 [Thermosipho melanesiensis]OOC39209.1 hypothetical protein SU70_04245 [Thermosipho melanesiensis]